MVEKGIEAVLPPQQPELTDDEWIKLRQDFADVFDARALYDRVEEALAHKASKKYSSTYLYCRNWLRRDAERLRERCNGRVPSRDVSKYAIWPDGRAR